MRLFFHPQKSNFTPNFTSQKFGFHLPNFSNIEKHVFPTKGVHGYELIQTETKFVVHKLNQNYFHLKPVYFVKLVQFRTGSKPVYNKNWLFT
jgi:hypothetical protein